VARRVGYSTYRDFHRNFVRLHHAPPRRFRQRHAGSGPAHGSPIPGGA
jgi:AraC-like DNA-binding protein